MTDTELWDALRELDTEAAELHRFRLDAIWASQPLGGKPTRKVLDEWRRNAHELLKSTQREEERACPK